MIGSPHLTTRYLLLSSRSALDGLSFSVPSLIYGWNTNRVCWFSTLLWEVFLRVLQFPLFDLQSPQIVEHLCLARTIWDLKLKTLTAYFFNFFVFSRTAFVTGFLMSLTLDSRKRVSFSSLWNNYENLNLLSWIFFPLAFLLFNGNNWRTNINADGGYCKITIQPRDVK